VIQRKPAGLRLDVGDRIETAEEELTDIGPVDIDLEGDQGGIGLGDDDVPQAGAVDDRELTSMVMLIELDAAGLRSLPELVE
jgi:hypothetical protein